MSSLSMSSVEKPRRTRPGTRNEEVTAWPEVPLDDLDGTMILQQHLEQLIEEDPLDMARLCTTPAGQSQDVWQYEHLRQFAKELNLLVVQLGPVCTSQTCPKMQATEEWIFLCAGHKNPQECCAIDYIIHTLDGVCCLLNSNKWFPSRNTVAANALKFFQPMARRLYRVYAHAYFHHREVFNEFENETHSCERFTKFSLQFDLITEALLIIPLFH